MAESAAFAAARDYFITQLKNGFTRVQIITALEQSGWKTDQLTALLCDPAVADCLKEYSATVMYASEEKLDIGRIVRPIVFVLVVLTILYMCYRMGVFAKLSDFLGEGGVKALLLKLERAIILR